MKKLIRKKFEKEIIILASIIAIGAILSIAGTILGVKNNSNNTEFNGDYGASSQSESYDWQQILTKSKNNDGSDNYTTIDKWNFWGKKNILIVFQTSGNFESMYHVSDSSDTNPSHHNNLIQYYNDRVLENSCDIFLSDSDIYLSTTPAGSAALHWKDFAFKADNNNTTINTIKIDGTVDRPGYGVVKYNFRNIASSDQNSNAYKQFQNDFSFSAEYNETPTGACYNAFSNAFFDIAVPDQDKIKYDYSQKYYFTIHEFNGSDN